MEHYMFSAFPRRGHRLNFRFNSKAPRKCCTISFPYTPKTFAKGLSANMALSFEQRKWMLKCYWKTENYRVGRARYNEINCLSMYVSRSHCNIVKKDKGLYIIDGGINYVVMRGFNEDEVCSFVELTKEKNVDVRFIEYMPFSGNKWNDGNMVSFSEMLQIIRKQWPNFDPLPNGPNDTSKRCNTKQMQ
ncbi:uncharacterized protein LOC126471507 [Schistocerca serialis cubense]|uniref:uncharacterized protein LOC126418816 n=1 Tax=Schistocerca serialis cubense TaxID=2023355 RepID=UPI00214F387D|nr:uncharacterized protein LOC126418816 [Schistocerca serialis cubense]XP_049941852.1 uncharacterized protein LOC126418889 isoform X1 [Schistocerca serialis cubense]XP_049941854.1 uncharacterized protein LOC126418889 isoform X2 [Schistocerca serialis cubense]XP_049941855.1 uncharacterized protein LOC126418889 isoform X2 [Schistocerca serialis cubense]XP_049955683.1 uncharacterized protein LOC126471506 [Schistocerca serialis cubense]XP_049955684.1 uncharacterized protein LOC126471506 [Schistoce